MKRLGALPLLFALALLCSTAQAEEVAVPKLTQRVTDLTATLDAPQIQALNARLASFEAGKGAQIAVLIVPSTQPETIEQFGIRVTDVWKLGRKGVDDGVLLLIAKDDHKLRIEVGYGLEGALPDATAKRIVSEIISPYFKRGDFYGGIDAGISAIITVVAGESLPPPPQRGQTSSSHGDSFSSLLGIGFIIFLFGNIILRQLLGRLPSGLVVGGLIGGLAWMMLLSAGLAIAAGIVAFVFSLMFGFSGRGSSFPIGWGGGGGGSFGGGGGGFGGGGGGFGGGGASGDW